MSEQYLPLYLSYRAKKPILVLFMLLYGEKNYC